MFEQKRRANVRESLRNKKAFTCDNRRGEPRRTFYVEQYMSSAKANEPFERNCALLNVTTCCLMLTALRIDPQAERGRGEVNLSPKEHLTLRPRVGGFEVGPIWIHVGVLVTESPQSLGSPHAGCLLPRE